MGKKGKQISWMIDKQPAGMEPTGCFGEEMHVKVHPVM